jgi:uncharacterized protein YllA (UPF0747 family)
VYWLETNDADFNEINHIDYLDASGQLQTLTWDIHTRGYSCGYVEVDASLVTLLETFFSTLRQTEFTPALKELSLRCYTKGRLLADASQQLASELFGRYNIRIFSPFETDFRDFSKKILIKEAERTPEGEQCNLFCMMGKQRKALFKKDGHYQLRDGTFVDLSLHDLVSNVKTRSVLQDAYFHTHTYVAGPAEVKYLAELVPVFQYHGVKAADVKPRMSLTLIEPRVKRIMKKRGIALEKILETTREDLLKEVMEEKAGFDFKETRQTSIRLTDEYLKKLETLGFETPDIKPIKHFLLDEVKNACGRLRSREKEKHDHLLKDIEYLSDNLRPFGKEQERVFNVFYYMNLFEGKDFINLLYDHYDWDRKILEING